VTAVLAAVLLTRAPQPLAEILFDMKGNQIWLRAELDEKPLRALLDTGSGSSAMDQKAAFSSGFIKQARKTFVGVSGGVVSGWTTKGRDVGLYGSTVVTPIFDVLPLHELDADESLPNAILGFEFFRSYVVQIDYRARMVRLYDPATYKPPAGYEALPIQFVDHIPTVEGKLSLPGMPQRPVVIEFDTGSAFGIDVSSRVVRRDALDLRYGDAGSDVSGGIGGAMASRSIGLSEVTLGGFRLSSETRLLLSGKPPISDLIRLPGDYDITLGNGVLSKFDIVFDYPHSRIYLKR